MQAPWADPEGVTDAARERGGLLKQIAELREEIDVWKEMYERQGDAWAMAHNLQHVCETQRVTIELLKAKLK